MERLFSNIEEIYEVNLSFWLDCLSQVVINVSTFNTRSWNTTVKQIIGCVFAIFFYLPLFYTFLQQSRRTHEALNPLDMADGFPMVSLLLLYMKEIYPSRKYA